MARGALALASLLFIGPVTLRADDVDALRALVGKAWMAEQQGRLDQALRLYRQAAEQGDPVAQYQLGLMHELGRGVSPDSDEAEYWYGRAVGQGYCPGEIPDPAEYAGD